jgi:hypothetical protein
VVSQHLFEETPLWYVIIRKVYVYARTRAAVWGALSVYVSIAGQPQTANRSD